MITAYLIDNIYTVTITTNLTQDNFRLLGICTTQQPVQEISGNTGEILKKFNQIEGNKFIFDNFLLCLDDGVYQLMDEIDI